MQSTGANLPSASPHWCFLQCRIANFIAGTILPPILLHNSISPVAAATRALNTARTCSLQCRQTWQGARANQSATCTDGYAASKRRRHRRQSKSTVTPHNHPGGNCVCSSSAGSVHVAEAPAFAHCYDRGMRGALLRHCGHHVRNMQSAIRNAQASCEPSSHLPHIYQ